MVAGLIIFSYGRGCHTLRLLYDCYTLRCSGFAVLYVYRSSINFFNRASQCAVGSMRPWWITVGFWNFDDSFSVCYFIGILFYHTKNHWIFRKKKKHQDFFFYQNAIFVFSHGLPVTVSYLIWLWSTFGTNYFWRKKK